jgi:hypothetical protein
MFTPPLLSEGRGQRFESSRVRHFMAVWPGSFLLGNPAKLLHLHQCQTRTDIGLVFELAVNNLKVHRKMVPRPTPLRP